MPQPSELLALATEIALEAGALLIERRPHVREFVGTKSSPTDMVTEVDAASEALIVERILAARPGDGILGEEGSAREGVSGVRWVIDPLDGTTNYLYGFPAYAVSIAVELAGETVAGAVYDAARAELFAAAKGSGVTLNGAPIRVSQQPALATALIGTGFGYDPRLRARQGALLAWLIGQVRDVRRAGSAALDLCSVACGRLDGYYEQGLNAWDHAAGALIVREAGGLADFPGDTGLTPRPIVAAGPQLHAQLTALLQRTAGELNSSSPN